MADSRIHAIKVGNQLLQLRLIKRITEGPLILEDNNTQYIFLSIKPDYNEEPNKTHKQKLASSKEKKSYENSEKNRLTISRKAKSDPIISEPKKNSKSNQINRSTSLKISRTDSLTLDSSPLVPPLSLDKVTHETEELTEARTFNSDSESPSLSDYSEKENLHMNIQLPIVKNRSKSWNTILPHKTVSDLITDKSNKVIQIRERKVRRAWTEYNIDLSQLTSQKTLRSSRTERKNKSKFFKLIQNKNFLHK